MAGRPIKTIYHNAASKVIRRNASSNPRNAIMLATGHIAMDDYGARFVEVYRDGETHPLLLMNRTPRHINTILKRDLGEK
jgi:hypothetical protein